MGTFFSALRSLLSCFNYPMAAHLLTEPDHDLSDWKKGLLPVLAILAPIFILVMLQPDIGTLAVLVVIVFALLYLSKLPRIYLLVLGLLALLAFAGLMMAAPCRMKRLTVSASGT